jgi:hypothetical protein
MLPTRACLVGVVFESSLPRIYRACKQATQLQALKNEIAAGSFNSLKTTHFAPMQMISCALHG